MSEDATSDDGEAVNAVGTRPLLIGAGRRLRRDLAVGLEVARLLAERSHDLEVVLHEGPLRDVLDRCVGRPAVLVRAVLAPYLTEPGRLLTWRDGGDDERLVVVGIVAARTDDGPELSPPVARALGPAVAEVSAQLGVLERELTAR